MITRRKITLCALTTTAAKLCKRKKKMLISLGTYTFKASKQTMLVTLGMKRKMFVPTLITKIWRLQALAQSNSFPGLFPWRWEGKALGTRLWHSNSVSSGYPNTEKRVKNRTRCGVFLTKFETKSVSGEVKSSKSMLIKTGYPNLLHGCDFLYFNLMKY